VIKWVENILDLVSVANIFKWNYHISCASNELEGFMSMVDFTPILTTLRFGRGILYTSPWLPSIEANYSAEEIFNRRQGKRRPNIKDLC
jgi:hypothetical protein